MSRPSNRLSLEVAASAAGEQNGSTSCLAHPRLMK
jgi:hypothetical protein